MSYCTRHGVAGKIEWEGGLFDALDYGLKTEDMPEDDKELREAWTRLRVAYDKAQEEADVVMGLLPCLT